jgi:peptidyl-prolyl cis-trans isomerase SurA
MLRINLLFIIFIIFLSINSFAQKEDNRVLLTIDDQKITVSEFNYVYNKNNGRSGNQDNTSLEDYLELFINFKLKVIEAQKLGMDTLSSFTNELKGYRAQLAQPYLVDKDVNEQLLKEAYDRLQYDVRASHIMKMIPENMDDDDSLAKAAYNSLIELRKRALKGEDFSKLAREFSDDPSARDQEANRNFPARKGNSGDLGYFTAFYMVYPFENAAYNTNVGEISMPIRTRYGYHLVKVTDKIPALGTIHVAHILVNTNPNQPNNEEESFKKIEEIRREILDNKISFEQAASKYSEDRGNAEKGGELNWFEVSKMVPQFIKGISEIDGPGGISHPVRTEYGWHLIKLLELKKVPPYNEYLPELKNKVSKDTRSNKSKEVAVEKFKKQYAFKEYPKALENFYAVVDSSIFEKNWSSEKAKGLKQTMFVINKKKFTQSDFAKYLEINQKALGNGTLKFLVHKVYNQWVSTLVLVEKDKMLETEEFDFKMLVREYHDGILLFNISDDKVWSKAIRDSAGLQDFFEAHKADYMWKQRIDAEIYRAKNDSIAQIIQTYLEKGLSKDSIVSIVNKNSQLNVGIEKGKFEQGDNKIIDSAKPMVGVQKYTNSDNLVYVIRIKSIIQPENKLINEARGIITADYQNYLHDEWIKNLRSKYKVELNKKVFETIEK